MSAIYPVFYYVVVTCFLNFWKIDDACIKALLYLYSLNTCFFIME